MLVECVQLAASMLSAPVFLHLMICQDSSATVDFDGIIIIIIIIIGQL